MSYITSIDINGEIYYISALTDRNGNHLVDLPQVSNDDTFVLVSNIVDDLESNSRTKPLSAWQGNLLKKMLNDSRTELNNAITDVMNGLDTRIIENKNAIDIINADENTEGSIKAAKKHLNDLLTYETQLLHNKDKEIQSSIEVLNGDASTNGSVAKALKDSNVYTDEQCAIKVDKVDGKDLSSNDYTSDEKNKLANIEDGANAYTHPVYVAKDTGIYKITVDELGHISDAVPVLKEDIVALGFTDQDIVYELRQANATTLGGVKMSDDWENAGDDVVISAAGVRAMYAQLKAYIDEQIVLKTGVQIAYSLQDPVE